MIAGDDPSFDHLRVGEVWGEGGSGGECTCAEEGGSQGDRVVLQLLKLSGGFGVLPDILPVDSNSSRALCSCTLAPVATVTDYASHQVRGWGKVTGTGIIVPLLRSPPPLDSLNIYSSVKALRKAILKRLFPLASNRPACEQKWSQELLAVWKQ